MQQFSLCGARLCAKHQPQRVGKQKRLVLCGRAAAGRDDTAALRGKMRTANEDGFPVEEFEGLI